MDSAIHPIPGDIRSAFKPLPKKFLGASLPVPTPKPAAPNPPARMQPKISIPISSYEEDLISAKPVVQKTQASKAWEPIDFSKQSIIRDDKIYDKNFRWKTEQSLKGTLKHAADRATVADLLWDKRGHGITKDEVKFGLRKLEKQGKLTFDQVKAVRRKLRDY
jgi:hypothetical protein